VSGPDLAERVMAEAWSAGALGIEESDGGGPVRLIVYLTGSHERGLREALEPFEGEGARWLGSESVEAVDWSERWRDGLEAIVVSPRLVVRPSFIAHEPSAGQHELIIDPGQAFGTGSHASTRLVLDWIDQLSSEMPRGSAALRVLDVGTGTGILAMAALRLGAQSAVGFDLDQDAVREAAVWAARNGLAEHLHLIVGPITALKASPFDQVLVNLLQSEMLPIAGEIAAATRPGGQVVLSGLLARDREEVIDCFEGYGLVPCDQRECVDERGDHWISPLLERRAER